MTIEEQIKKWLESKNKKFDIEEIEKNLDLLREVFIAGYNQAIEDRIKILG